MIRTLGSEVGVFENRLGPPVRRLFASNIFQGVAEGFASVFIGAFIWYTTGSLTSVALYYIGQYSLLPVAFMLNGVLLRSFNIRSLFFLGAAIAGLSTLGVVMFAGAFGSLAFLLLGAVQGLGQGIYWPNRNYLELQEVADESRNYYFGAVSAVTGISGIFVPFMAGWFIAAGRYTGWYSTTNAYWLVFGVSFLLMLLAGAIVGRGQYASPRPARVTRFASRPLVTKRRAIAFTLGLANGIGFIAPVLVLMHLGNEGVLGTLTAAAAIIVAVCMYLYGRLGGVRQRYQVSLGSSVGFAVCGALLLMVPGPLAILLYVLLMKPARDFLFMGLEPIILALTDKEMTGKDEERYSFVVDNEFFLNLGRVSSLLFVALLAVSTTAVEAAYYAPLCIGIVQLTLFTIIFKKKSIV